MNISFKASYLELKFGGYSLPDDCMACCEYRFFDKKEIERFKQLIRRIYIDRAKNINKELLKEKENEILHKV